MKSFSSISMMYGPYHRPLCIIIITFLAQIVRNSSTSARDCSADTGNDGTCTNADVEVATRATKVCALIKASDVKQMGIEPTYFQGGWGSAGSEGDRAWNWPWNWFAMMLKHYGWTEVGRDREDCSKATFKILYADKGMGDGDIYEKYCHSNDHVGLAFGFDNVSKEFGKKNTFVQNVRDYEKAKDLHTSIVPLSFNLDQESECKAFFAHENVEQMKWISKATNKFGGRGVDVIFDFEAFEAKFGGCSPQTGAPQIQEYVEPPLIDEKIWTFREYLFIVSLNPLVALRRDGNVLLCSEPYERRWDNDPTVKRRATNCNTYVSITHPSYGKEDGGLTMTDFKKPLEYLIPALREDEYKLFLDKVDTALSVLVRAMEQTISAEVASPDHAVGHYAVDGMMDRKGNVKLLELNPCAGRGKEKNQVAEARIALTSFLQYGLQNSTYDVAACIEEYPQFSQLPL